MWRIAILASALLFWRSARGFAAEDRATIEVCRDGPGSITVLLPVGETLRLDDTEEAMACGTKKSPGWQQVPLAQARYFMKVFLAARGYHKPTFRFEGDRLTAESGPMSFVDHVTVIGSPVPIDVSRYWRISGSPMTSKALNDLSAWLKRELARQGYPCADVQLAGDPVTGLVTATVHKPIPMTFPEVTELRLPGVNSHALHRYLAFAPGDPFDILNLDLSTKRMIEDEVVLNADFTTACSKDAESVRIEPNLIAGAPRLVSFGAGVDTEEFLIAEAAWRHSRLGSDASLFQAQTHLSFRRERADTSFDWYYTPTAPRHFLRAAALIERANEPRYESRMMQGRGGPGWGLDSASWRYDLWTGLAYERIDTVRGFGPPHSRNLAAQATLDVASHPFEFYRASPREGATLHLGLKRAKRDYGSDISATKYTANGTVYWNLFALDPAVWIVGVRGGITSTVVDGDTTHDRIPETYRDFLGGSTNLRGFGRESLPPQDAGALTTAYSSLELRIDEVLPYKLQPILFTDIGTVRGDAPEDIERSRFWSPGFGINWQSFIGTFRFTFAHGFIDGPARERLTYLSRWQFFFGYGEQF